MFRTTAGSWAQGPWAWVGELWDQGPRPWGTLALGRWADGPIGPIGPLVGPLIPFPDRFGGWMWGGGLPTTISQSERLSGGPPTTVSQIERPLDFRQSDRAAIDWITSRGIIEILVLTRPDPRGLRLFQ